MAIEHPENWFLKKHDNGEVFGPVHFDKIRDWARSAQVNPQDMLSSDRNIWNRAPMIPEMEMDWLVVVDEHLLYGPTTAEALLEFEQIGEIAPETHLINSCTGQEIALADTPFYQTSQREPKEEQPLNPLLGILPGPGKASSARVNLQKRVRELEAALLDKRRKLMASEETIARLEARIRELEARIRDFSGFRST